MEQTKKDATFTVLHPDFYQKELEKKMEMKPGKMYSEVVGTQEKEAKNMSQQYVTEKDLTQLEDKIDLKIRVAIQPIEGKIDVLSEKVENLPTKFENLLLNERQYQDDKAEETRRYQDDKAKETRRYIIGTIGIGVVSIIVSVVLNFI